MPASQSTSTTRRPILRFDLASISIDDRPNAYKKPQLVIKPQLELAPRRPYTGSRPRMPVWRHFLMVHVKDKADEFVCSRVCPLRHMLMHPAGEVGPGHLPTGFRRWQCYPSPFRRLSVLQLFSPFPAFDRNRECE
jgi:hypothetical protein